MEEEPALNDIEQPYAVTLRVMCVDRAIEMGMARSAMLEVAKEIENYILTGELPKREDVVKEAEKLAAQQNVVVNQTRI